jgi:ABC-type glutathione transport system ATPase component
MMQAIVLENISLAYSSFTAVHPLSLEFKQGERIGLTGTSGCGKTTLARAISGVNSDSVRVVSGRIHRQGRAVYIPQEPQLWFSPYLKLGGQVLDCAPSASKASVLCLFQQLGLGDPELIYRSYPHQVSGGQLQRVAWAQAWIANPDFIIADEPTASLDSLLQREVMTLALRQVRQRGVGLLWISHDLNLLRALGGNLMVMHQGHIIEQGQAELIASAPQHPETTRLLEAWL